MGSLLHHLRRIALVRQCVSLTDGELLDGFVGRRDGACFEALVRRHGPMVLGVCRRVLRNYHDAEDAFQATFLVLARRAAAVPRAAVGNWLYGVAYRTALGARRAAARRRAKERPEDNMPQPTTRPKEPWDDLRPLLDEELSRMPDKLRSAVVLCDLEGRTRAEAARHLGVPEGTVSGRLTVARRLLARRLTRRGLTLSAGALGAVLAEGGAAAAVPFSLVAAAVRAGEAMAAGAVTGVVSTQVAALADGVARGLVVAKWKPLLVVLAVVPVFAAVTAALPGRVSEPTPPRAAGDPVPPPPARAASAPRSAERTDREKLQGTWLVAAAESNGESVLDPGFRGNRFVFAGDRVTYLTEKDKVQEGTYHLDPTQSPGVLDVKLGGDAAMNFNFIYQLTDTRLTLCWRKGGPRPGGFDMTREFDAVLFVYQKQ